MNAERFDELCSGLLEGELNASSMDELAAILAAEPGLLQRTADLYEIHRALGQIHQPHDSAAFANDTLTRMNADREAFIGSLKTKLREVTPSQPKSASRFNRFNALAIAAAVIIAALIVYTVWPNSKSVAPRIAETPDKDSAQPIRFATLVRSIRARWEPDIKIEDGQRLEPGPLRLGTGNAILLFDSGAVVAVQGPAHLRLESRGVLRVDQGRVTVRAEGDAAGFTVRTPSGDAQDLGTEFSVAVNLSGSAEVHVIQGEVAWLAKTDSAPKQILHKGEAARFDSASESKGHSIAFAAQSIDDFLRQLAGSVPPSRPLAYDGFEYAAGEMPIENASGGFGWKHAWRERQGDERTREADTNSLFAITPESLQLQSAQKSATGGALILPPGSSHRVRELDDPIDLGRDAIYYISFMARRSRTVQSRGSGVPHLRLTLRSSKDFWGPSLGVGYPDSRHPTLQLYSRDTYVAPIVIESDTTALWVLKIVSRRDHQGEAYLKVFKSGEALSEFEPTPWSVVTDRFPATGILDLVVVTGSGPDTHIFDELRIGRTWDSVVQKN